MRSAILHELNQVILNDPEVIILRVMEPDLDRAIVLLLGKQCVALRD